MDMTLSISPGSALSGLHLMTSHRMEFYRRGLLRRLQVAKPRDYCTWQLGNLGSNLPPALTFARFRFALPDSVMPHAGVGKRVRAATCPRTKRC